MADRTTIDRIVQIAPNQVPGPAGTWASPRVGHSLTPVGVQSELASGIPRKQLGHTDRSRVGF